ncbi:MAG TPA: hypothetical protein VGH23_01780 [Rhizomicrobium sp.]|jgi:hypothetical protein
MRRNFTLLTLVAASALSLTACDSRPSRVCAGPNGQRVDDANCNGAHYAGGNGSGGWLYRWYYMRGGSGPAVGETVTGGSFTPASGVSYSTVSRGGFGGEGFHFGGFGE